MGGYSISQTFEAPSFVVSVEASSNSKTTDVASSITCVMWAPMKIFYWLLGALWEAHFPEKGRSTVRLLPRVLHFTKTHGEDIEIEDIGSREGAIQQRNYFIGLRILRERC